MYEKNTVTTFIQSLRLSLARKRATTRKRQASESDKQIPRQTVVAKIPFTEYSRFALTNTFGTFRYFVFVTDNVFVISFPTKY